MFEEHGSFRPPPRSSVEREIVAPDSDRNPGSGVADDMSSEGGGSNLVGMEEDQAPEPETLAGDRVDILIDRLDGLIQRLSGRNTLRETSVEAIYAKLDEMENLIDADGDAAQTRKSRHSPFLEQGDLLLPPSRPQEHRPQDLLAPGTALNDPAPAPVAGNATAEGTEGSAEVPERLTAEAQKLCHDLNSVISSLQARREETEHLSAILIERAEGAAKRILELEQDIARLEDEVDGNESELQHLRLQLRALEVTCYEYVPPDADPELQQSIENWKSDWARLRREMAASKRRRNPQADLESALSTPTASMLFGNSP